MGQLLQFVCAAPNIGKPGNYGGAPSRTDFHFLRVGMTAHNPEPTHLVQGTAQRRNRWITLTKSFTKEPF